MTNMDALVRHGELTCTSWLQQEHVQQFNVRAALGSAAPPVSYIFTNMEN